MTLKTVLMDLDGTVYRGKELIDGAPEAIDYIRRRGLNLFFFTNNSEKNRQQIAERLINMGIDCSAEDVINSGYIAMLMIKDRRYGKVFLSGSPSLREEFLKGGIELTDGSDADVLVIGMDTEFTFQKMKSALNAALNAKVIIACNVERIYPCGEGKFCPGNGALVASIEYSSNRKVDEIIGKPNTPMLEYLMKITGDKPEEIVVVGDTFDSDIALAKKCHARGILIGSNPGCDICIGSIAELPGILEELI